MNAPLTAEVLAQCWLAAKKREQDANKERVSIEGELCALLAVKPEGATTHELDGFKVVTTGKLSRKLDLAAFDKVALDIPEELRPIKVKRELDEVGFKWLAANRPELHALVATCVTTTPAKTAVEVKAIDKE